jgi:hypothetical protein
MSPAERVLTNGWTAAVMQAPIFDGSETGYANIFALALQACMGQKPAYG